MTKQEFVRWLQLEIAGLDHPEPDTAMCESAADSVRRARLVAQSLGYADLVPPCAELISLPNARAVLARCLAAIDPPASGPLTVKQAAERMGVSPKTIYDLIDKGRLRCSRIGRAIRIEPRDLAMGTEETKYKHLRL